MQVHGWKLYFHPAFKDQFDKFDDHYYFGGFIIAKTNHEPGEIGFHSY